MPSDKISGGSEKIPTDNLETIEQEAQRIIQNRMSERDFRGNAQSHLG